MSGFQPSKGQNAPWCKCCSGGSCTVGSHKTKVRLNSLRKMPKWWWSWDTSLEQSLSHWQKSVELHTNPYTYHHQSKGGKWGRKTPDRHEWHSRQTAHSHNLEANTQALKNLVWDPTKHNLHQETRNLTQTLPKLHLDTLKVRVCIGSKWPIISSFLEAWSDYQYSYIVLPPG